MELNDKRDRQDNDCGCYKIIWTKNEKGQKLKKIILSSMIAMAITSLSAFAGVTTQTCRDTGTVATNEYSAYINGLCRTPEVVTALEYKLMLENTTLTHFSSNPDQLHKYIKQNFDRKSKNDIQKMIDLNPKEFVAKANALANGKKLEVKFFND
jgi:hypothetical protein